jgi:hypothetical protein
LFSVPSILTSVSSFYVLLTEFVFSSSESTKYPYY